jgi:hypothetical protein
MIYERLSNQGRLENILEFTPAQDWKNQIPRKVLQPGYKTSEK